MGSEPTEGFVKAMYENLKHAYNDLLAQNERLNAEIVRLEEEKEVWELERIVLTRRIEELEVPKSMTSSGKFITDVGG
jgi:predicted  nucleic acid-binding Zn-ribbon protein